MQLIVKPNRSVSKEYFENEGTKYENIATTLIFDIPEELEGRQTSELNKYIVFDIDSVNNRDVVIGNTYEVPYAITSKGTVACNFVLKERGENENPFVWISEQFVLNFNEATEYGQEIVPTEDIDIINEIISRLNEEIEKVENLDITSEETEEGIEVTFTDKEGHETIRTVRNGTEGEDGEDGATFTPSVSDEGIISWTNDKELPNPESRNIKGPQGNTGDSGVRVQIQEPTDPIVNLWIDTDEEADFDPDDYLSKTNTEEYTPNFDYNPATKKYVDDGLSEKIDTSDIVNNVVSIDTDKPLSANMGKEIQDEIDNLKARGRFLALWNSVTGLAMSNPQTSPYTYTTGDYFIVGVTGTTNYKPTGSTYVIGQASTTVETDSVAVDDVYYYDGTNWKLQVNTQKTVSFANIAGQPTDNSNLASALNNKENTSNKVTTISSSSTDTQYPSAKAVYDYIQSLDGNEEVY